MANTAMTSDERLLELFRRQGALGIGELVAATHVTATAVRQRLSRLIDRGLVDRVTHHASRGRPSHRYQLSAKGQRAPGNNFADLALILWRELRNVKDEELRQDLFRRVARALAAMVDRRRVDAQATGPQAPASWAATTQPAATQAGETTSNATQGNGSRGDQVIGERMRDIVAALAERNVPFIVEPMDSPAEHSLPVLTALACPFPDLAEEDRGICDVERMMFEQLIGAEVRLAECRLDGARCCKFAMN
jgi:predicted ArsR family transcriptional regulator